MTNQGRTIRVTVLTSDGSTHVHDCENTPQNQSEVDGLFAEAVEVISGGTGIIVLANPMAIYSVPHIIRMNQSVVE